MSKVEWMPSRFVYSLESPSILLMLNFAHDGRMFTQLNKASIPHTHARFSTRHRMATRSGHCLYFLLSLACLYVEINLSKLPDINSGENCGKWVETG